MSAVGPDSGAREPALPSASRRAGTSPKTVIVVRRTGPRRLSAPRPGFNPGRPGGRRRSEPPLEFRAIGLHPLIDPAEYRVVPENPVGGFEHPVILRLEVEKFRRDVLGLQHLEHRQALARIDAVVVAAVDDE